MEVVDCPLCKKRHYLSLPCPDDACDEKQVYSVEDFEDGLRRPLVLIEDS
jgi:hypothetical protein